jgi:serine/threonine protein kinase
MQGFHDAGYVHGDVKPGNFVLVEPSCFIAASMPAGGLKAVDVGCSQAVAPVSGRLSRRAGTPMFMAPEVCICRAVYAWECETRSGWLVARRGPRLTGEPVSWLGWAL